MTRSLIAVAFVALSGCAGSAAPAPTSASDPGPPAVASGPAPATPTVAAPVTSDEPAPASREERRERVRRLLEGRVPEPDLPTDSGG